MTYADKFKVPDLSIDDLSDKVPSGPLQEICDDFLGPSHPAQVFSAQYFDKNDKPLFFYLARRRRREKETKVRLDFVRGMFPLFIFSFQGEGLVQAVQTQIRGASSKTSQKGREDYTRRSSGEYRTDFCSVFSRLKRTTTGGASCKIP
jgi:hypothetical protein